MNLPSSEDLRCKYSWVVALTLIFGVFFLGLFLIKRPNIAKLIFPIPALAKSEREIFGFAPHWKLSKLDNIDWDTLTTFAYFSIPVNADGSFDKLSYEWEVFEGSKLKNLFEKARDNNVRRVVTLTMMEKPTIEAFLLDETAWDEVASGSVAVLRENDLDGVNVDFEYIPANDELKKQFTKFIEKYSNTLEANLDDPYITVSVLASSVRFGKIYDIGALCQLTDGIFMMAYDFYYPGSQAVGPSAPLYGYNDGRGPFWYDVATAVEDFLTVAEATKIIMGVPYYGWNYPTDEPSPASERGWGRAFATTNEKVEQNKLLLTTPLGGWDSQAQVAWRGYWDENGWHVVYMEDEKSLSAKFDFAKDKNLGGVGIWALGFDSANDNFWKLLADKFKTRDLAAKPERLWAF